MESDDIEDLLSALDDGVVCTDSVEPAPAAAPIIQNPLVSHRPSFNVPKTTSIININGKEYLRTQGSSLLVLLK